MPSFTLPAFLRSFVPETASGRAHLMPSTMQENRPQTLTPESSNGYRENFILPDTTGVGRTLRVFLPPSYRSQPNKSYPLLVMQDGQNLFEDETAHGGISWKLGAAMLSGLREGRLKEFIAVGIDNGTNRFEEYTPWRDDDLGRGGDVMPYLNWLESTVLPELERRYRITPQRESRVIGGSSLGAVASLCALAKKSHLFGGAILMSCSWQWQNRSLLRWLATQFRPTPDTRIFLSIGEREHNLENTQIARQIFSSKEVGLKEPDTLGYYVSPAASHTPEFWKQTIPYGLEFFFPANR